MKKMSIAAIILSIAIICASVVGVVALTHNTKPAENDEPVLYPLTTVVNEVIEEADLVVVVDHEGNVWEFYGVEDWEEGDIATLLMDACDVFDDYDDKIVEIRYGGTTKGF